MCLLGCISQLKIAKWQGKGGGGTIRLHKFFASRHEVQLGRTSQGKKHNESQVQTS
jgi:hypothetical protein